MIIHNPFLFKQVISPSLSPNTESDDVFEALRVMLQPWNWRRGRAVDEVERWFSRYFQTDTVVTFNSGRSGLFALLKAFGIGRGDEVLIQAFTCVAVSNSVLWTGARPVYVDIDKTFNLDPFAAEKKLTRRTKAIIVQHTFGIPAQMDTLVAWAHKHNLILIEDCAHSLGATYNGKKVGTLGDAAFFSFGRDKALSSVWGGAAIINEECKIKNVKSKLREQPKQLPVPGNFWIFQQLLHPLAFSFILPLYDVIIGKVLLFLLQKLNLLSLPVYPEEKVGLKPSDFPAKFPNALARLLLRQLGKLERYTQRRQEIARLYRDALSKHRGVVMPPDTPEASYLRFPILVGGSAKLLKEARYTGIILGNWYHNIIDPKGVNRKVLGYPNGSCPRAEQYARQVVNLPTLISRKQAERVIATLLAIGF